MSIIVVLRFRYSAFIVKLRMYPTSGYLNSRSVTGRKERLLSQQTLVSVFLCRKEGEMDINYGRRIIYTDIDDVTEENVVSILRNAMITHSINRDRCTFLINYDAGVQPLIREKTYRTDIDIHCVDNVANEVTEFKLGFVWGNPITITQRGKSEKNSQIKAITKLNELYDVDNNRSKLQALARFIEICGVGYELVDINPDYVEGENAPFTIEPLDPRNAFVVRSTRLGNPVILGVVYTTDVLGNNHFTCFSKNARYEVLNTIKLVNPNTNRKKSVDEWTVMSQETLYAENPLGEIPIVEWVRSADRMGCFERQISEMDNLNILVSDFSNDVDQNTQAIWTTIDVDFPKDPDTQEEISPKSGDWLRMYSTKDGKSPSVNALANPYDYGGMLNNIVTRRALILQKCNVPQRNDNSGGSTGIAMSDATGWSAAESSACKQESIMNGCKMNEIKLVLRAMNVNPLYKDQDVKGLKIVDLEPSIKRQKTYEMTTKINAFCNAVSHGLDYKSMIREISFFADPEQVISDSEESMRRYLDKEFPDKEKETEEEENKQLTPEQLVNSSEDPVNQIDNSPNLDGMKTQKSEDK